MNYQFKNLVFEGGGVKGLAYVGAMEVLEQKGILSSIKRVGGTSAGAINALLFSLGYSNNEQKEILKSLDFKNFMDDSWGIVRDTKRLIEEFGWYKGQFFHDWVTKIVDQKLGFKNATFADLYSLDLPDLYVYATNISTTFGEVFSFEHTPYMRIADAVRISMSIPLFFASVRNPRGDVYVDGGVLNNFPIKLFDRLKYIASNDQNSLARHTDYYEKENREFLLKHPKSSPYVYNCETLGFRLDSKQEIAVFRDQREPQHAKINDFFDYIRSLVNTVIEAQGTQHLHSDDWHRTVYIDTLGVKTTEFSLSESKKNKLIESGKKHTEGYFDWFDKSETYNKPGPNTVAA